MHFPSTHLIWLIISTFGSFYFFSIEYLANELDENRHLSSQLNTSPDFMMVPELVSLEGGLFSMGCNLEFDADCMSDEIPLHTVFLEDFSIGKYEVTQIEWEAIMGNNPSIFTQCGNNCPIENVSFYDVITYCNRLSQQDGLEPCYYFDENFNAVFDTLDDATDTFFEVYWLKTADGYRIPTEAEWEFAAKSGVGSTFLYSGSNDIDAVAWYRENSDSSLQIVGQKNANAFGLHDMSGNVYEWCWDGYADDYYSFSPPCTPDGAVINLGRVIRGGSWLNSAASSKAANRGFLPGNNQNSRLGFRIAKGAILSNNNDSDCLKNDSLALLKLLEIANGENWTFTENTYGPEQSPIPNAGQEWVPGIPISMWHGVQTNEFGRVTQLILPNNGLRDSLPTKLEYLSELTHLILNDNSLSGSLPQALGQLSNLEYLDLNNNFFVGEIPTGLGNLIKLKEIYLYGNQIRGQLPTFEGLDSLFDISIGGNFYSGLVPDFGQIHPLLTSLSIDNNQLTFSDLLPHFSSNRDVIANNSIDSNFLYAPQRPIWPDTLIIITAGDSLTIDLEIDAQVTSNNYTWTKNGVDFERITGNNKLEFPAILLDDRGVYGVKITNPQVPALTLESGEITIQVNTRDCANSDFDALMAFYDATNGSNWESFAKRGWEDGKAGIDCEFCLWYGIECNADGRVVSIDFDGIEGGQHDSNGPGVNLTGSIPPEIGNLSELVFLNLRNNQLEGTIPVEISQLNLLVWLYLSSNRLKQTLPAFLGDLPALTYLYLSDNEFSGSIPDNWNRLSNLQILHARNNDISGDIPPWLGQLSNLKGIYLNGNELSGAIPESLGDLNLEQIFLQNNQLNGCFPPSFLGFCNNLSFDFSGNTDLLPDSGNFSQFCSEGVSACDTACKHPDLDALLDFYDNTNGPSWTNQFGWQQGKAGTDCDPCSWHGIECQGNRVTKLDLTNNNLSGQLTDLNLPNLLELVLDDNVINGNILDFSNLPNLIKLDLSNNQLSGFIPNFSSLDSLKILDLGVNRLSGNIPNFSNLPNLIWLYLSFNELQGTIPELSNILNLTRLYLENNLLEGCFPDGLQKYCSLGASNNPLQDGYSFLNNPKLPWSGDLTPWCNEENDVGATCNDQNIDTEIDIITLNCECIGFRTLTITSLTEDVTCPGDQNGSIDLSLSGGSGDFSFLWDYQNRTTEDLNNLPPGNYQVTISDNITRTENIRSFEIQSPSLLNIKPQLNHPTCADLDDGSIKLAPEGGIPPYSFIWMQDSSSDSILTNLSAGNYSVTLTDANDCSINQTYSLESPSEIIISENINAATCPDEPSGKISLSVTGGSGDSFEYVWSNGDTTSNLMDLLPGNYSVTIQDDNNCITEETFLVSSVRETCDACEGIIINPPLSNGGQSFCKEDPIPILSVTVSEGQIANWYDSPNGGQLLAANSSTYQPIQPGNYFVEAQSEANQCVSSSRSIVTLSLNPTPIIKEWQKVCDPTTQTATIFLNVDFADTILTNIGTLFSGDQENTYFISGIPIGESINVIAANNNDCTTNLLISGECCTVPPPIVPNNRAIICLGNTDPVSFVAMVPAGQTVYWYDQLKGGNLLLKSSLTFTTLEQGLFYAETRGVDDPSCFSETRTRVQVGFIPDNNPAIEFYKKHCSEDGNFYTVEFTVLKAQEVYSNQNQIQALDSNNYRISNIPIVESLVVSALNLNSGCESDFNTSAPQCGCTNIPLPETSYSFIEYCKGTPPPVLEVRVPDGYSVNWFDQPDGGRLLKSNSIIFEPPTQGHYFAETIQTEPPCVSNDRLLIIVEELPLSITDTVIPTCDIYQVGKNKSGYLSKPMGL